MKRKAFTLAELMVVIGIIVLIVALAIPAFSVITGNRSIEATQNQLQAILGRARQEALGLQDFRGVILFTDPNTGRMCASEVYYPDPQKPGLLDVVPNRDETLLPKGIGAAAIQNKGSVTGLTLIMFDGQGQFVTKPYVIDTTQTTANNAVPGSTLAARVQPFPVSADNTHLPSLASDSSDFGIILYPDPDAFSATLQASGGSVVVPQPAPPPPAQPPPPPTPAGTYLGDQGEWFMIGRYNGQLIRSE